MIEMALTYIHSVRPNKRFVGCGALVEGGKGYIVTCRHVWREATAAAAKTDPPVPLQVEVEFPYSRRNGAMVHSLARLIDDCAPLSDEEEPDVVLLQSETLPSSGVMNLQLAVHHQFEVGKGYTFAGLIRDPDRPNAVRVVKLHGTIADLLLPDGRRQFTGANPTAYWSEKGSSGSPVFLDGGQQLAGLLSLSEIGANPGETHLHEAFIVPATTIRRYVVPHVKEEIARVDIDSIRPVLDAMGVADIPVHQIPDLLRQFVEKMQGASTQIKPAKDRVDRKAERSETLAEQPAGRPPVPGNESTPRLTRYRNKAPSFLPMNKLRNRRGWSQAGGFVVRLLVRDAKDGSQITTITGSTRARCALEMNNLTTETYEVQAILKTEGKLEFLGSQQGKEATSIMYAAAGMTVVEEWGLLVTGKEAGYETLTLSLAQRYHGSGWLAASDVVQLRVLVSP